MNIIKIRLNIFLLVPHLFKNYQINLEDIQLMITIIYAQNVKNYFQKIKLKMSLVIVVFLDL